MAKANPKNALLQTFTHNLVTKGVRTCNSLLYTDIWHVTSCMIA